MIEFCDIEILFSVVDRILSMVLKRLFKVLDLRLVYCVWSPKTSSSSEQNEHSLITFTSASSRRYLPKAAPTVPQLALCGLRVRSWLGLILTKNSDEEVLVKRELAGFRASLFWWEYCRWLRIDKHGVMSQGEE